MLPKLSLACTCVALVGLGAATGAQTANAPSPTVVGNGGGAPTKQKLMRRYEKALTPVHLDLETGTITRGSRPGGQKNATTCVSFNNNDLAGFVGVDTGSCACEWVDFGTKSACKSSFVSSFTFAYCSAATDTLSGGSGGAATISFRTGYSKNPGIGGAPGGTEIGRFSLTGLPANTSCSSFFGGFRCFFITVSFGSTPLCMPDGDIGWGFKFDDLGTDGSLSKTFPFLSCVASCSGFGPDGQNMTNCVDQYCPPGTLLSSFSFGTISNTTWTSFSMAINEVVPVCHQQNYCIGNSPCLLGGVQNGGLVHPLGYTLWDKAGDEDVSMKIGDNVERLALALDCTQATPGIRTIVFRTGSCRAVPLPTAFGDLWCSGQVIQRFPGVHTSNVVCTPSLVVPKDLDFVCVRYCVQGFCGKGPGQGGYLSNAIEGRIGVPVKGGG